MIETIQNYSRHTLFGILAEGFPALIDTLNAVVHSVAISILAQVIITIPLFLLHHNLFALGFVIGFVFDKQVREVVEKVNLVYNAQKTLLQKVVFFGGGGFLAILTMPTSMIIATLYYSAQWGALLYQTSLASQKQPVKQPIDNDKKENNIDLKEVVVDGG